MSRGLSGPGPNDRPQPAGRRNPDGTRAEADEEVNDPSNRRRAVLSAVVINEPGVTAELTSLFARRQVNIERIVGEPMGDGTRSRITFVVEPPHPGVEQVRRQVQKLLPVVSVEERDLETAERLTAAIDDE